jgi:hypothetical protein
VGLASAKSPVYAGVTEVEAGVTGAPAVRFAERAGLFLRVVMVIPRVLNCERTGLCLMGGLASWWSGASPSFGGVARRLGLAEGDADGTGTVG